ncbi:Hypothetical predicted protein [Marmota monax]|uniref:Kelch repeat and BTB domain-containing protein 2 n=1 Tax=Marmota monax TaxID=9995 RepID=A0A5E4CHT2_MARMO|nr:kelch repeat and BTB domain-containing protein 2 [Marmota monax]VTJ80482.1 Hypothetical predicted protein [Marmota monax]
MSTQDERQINTEYAVSLLEQLKLFYEQQLFTDIVLIVEGTEFPCHKMVLATCSSYFRAMFMSGLSESKQTHVHLRNVDAATLQIIITYAYTGNLAISDSTVEQLYETACFLQVSSFFPLGYVLQLVYFAGNIVLLIFHVCSFLIADFKGELFFSLFIKCEKR